MKLQTAMLAVLLVVVVSAQEKPQTPVLSETQALQLRANLLRVENAQLKLQLIVAEFQKAQADAQALVKSLQREGYTLDFEKLVYVPTPQVPPK